MKERKNRQAGPGAGVRLLGVDSVDTRAYHGHPGDLILKTAFGAEQEDAESAERERVAVDGTVCPELTHKVRGALVVHLS